jgi:hypothetical protein
MLNREFKENNKGKKRWNYKAKQSNSQSIWTIMWAKTSLWTDAW